MTAEMPAPPKPRVKESVDRFVARVRHNIDVHLETLAQDLVKALQDEGSASADPHDSRFDVLAKLVGAMRMLDEATSLKGILEGLARGGAGQANRVAVFLLEGQTLRAFAEFGYIASPRPADVPVDSYGALARTVNERQRTTVSAAAGCALRCPRVHEAGARQGRRHRPARRRRQRRRDRLCRRPGPPCRSGCRRLDRVDEVLVRHAASRLENVTSIRTVEVLTKPA